MMLDEDRNVQELIETKCIVENECTADTDSTAADGDNAESHDRAKQGGSPESLSPAEKWIQINPPMRQREVEFLAGEHLGFAMQFTDDGELQQPFTVDQWTFLLVLGHSFPRRLEQGAVPARVYLVSPSADELARSVPHSALAQVRCERPGMAYIDFGDDGEREYERYLDGQSRNHMSGNMLHRTGKWVKKAQKVIKRVDRSAQRTGVRGIFQRGRPESNVRIEFTQQRPKYTDGRASRHMSVHPCCHKVVLSDRAYIQILNESQARIQTETGGLLLGHFDQGVWYVVEASDPGINAKFFGSYHEGDDVYENHVCGVISRTYKYPLVFLGMWHRHPGSLDSFSGTDDGTNFKYAASAGNGCISAIINYDPEFRITFYYVEQGGPSRVLYTCVDVEVGNDKFLKPEMMQIASQSDVMSRMRY